MRASSAGTRKPAAAGKRISVVRNTRNDTMGGDWADAAQAAGSAVVVRPLRPTSIKLEGDLIARLTQKGKKRGLPYQTMLKLILRENI